VGGAGVVLAWLSPDGTSRCSCSARGVPCCSRSARRRLRRAAARPLHAASSRRGPPSILLVAVSLPAFAHYLRVAGRTTVDDRGAAWWLAACSALRALARDLELAERLFPGLSLDASFQRGHTGVSAFWACSGSALYAGLTPLARAEGRGPRALRGQPAKIFLYDLPSLSSVTRALSFLVVARPAARRVLLPAGSRLRRSG